VNLRITNLNSVWLDYESEENQVTKWSRSPEKVELRLLNAGEIKNRKIMNLKRLYESSFEPKINPKSKWILSNSKSKHSFKLSLDKVNKNKQLEEDIV